MEINWEDLLREAKRGMDLAYAPYSHYKVGAAVLSGSGKIYTGCNIENASFPMSMCAERVAIFKAFSEGEREFLALAVVANSSTLSVPCGGCRQVIVEFAPEMPIALCNNDGKRKIIKAKDLLPLPFTKDYLEDPDI